MQSCCKALGVMGQTIQKVRLTSDMHGPLQPQPKAHSSLGGCSFCVSTAPLVFIRVIS